MAFDCQERSPVVNSSRVLSETNVRIKCQLHLSTCALPLRQPLILNLVFPQSSESTWKSYLQMRLGAVHEYFTLVVKAINATIHFAGRFHIMRPALLPPV